MARQTAEELVPLEDVQRLVLDACPTLEVEHVDIDAALGCVLGADVHAPEALPPFANSAMDGYAVRAGDVAGAPVELEVVGVLAAGAAPARPVGPGEAIQIMTGAPIPEGADSIAIVELTEAGSTPGTVRILERTDVGQHIRRAGDDLAEGALALAAGTVLGPAQIGLLASVGAAKALVCPRPRVAVLSTGDELVDAGTPLRLGQIRDSNRHGLVALLRRDGFEPIDLGVVPDDKEEIATTLRRGVERCDAVLTSGGVSMGEFDFVKVALDELVAERGGAVHQLKIAIRPAKPLSFGTVARPGRPAVPVFGLPGNPVSSMVSYQVIALPALRKLAGHHEPVPESLPAVAGEELRRHPDGKLHLVRVVASMDASGRIVVHSAGGQGSHQLAAMAAANALALVPDGTGIAAGDPVQVLLMAGVGAR